MVLFGIKLTSPRARRLNLHAHLRTFHHNNMKNSFTHFTLLLSSLAIGTLCSPAPLNESGNYVGERRAVTTTTVTTTVISTRISTVTMCPTGTSTSRPLTTTINTQLTTTRPSGTSTTTATSSAQPTFDGCTYNVPEAGKFKNKKKFTFFQSGLPEGLYASNYVVYDTYNGLPYNHKFETTNVYSDGDFLNLRVQGTTNPGSLANQAISCGELVTTENNILYASVRTNAIFSTVPGTCHGESRSGTFPTFCSNNFRHVFLPR